MKLLSLAHSFLQSSIHNIVAALFTEIENDLGIVGKLGNEHSSSQRL